MAKIYSIKGNASENTEHRTVTVDLSPRLMFLIGLIFCVMLFGKKILSILMFLALSFVFMSVSLPIVEKLRSKGVSKYLSIFLAYSIVVLVLVSVFALVVVPFVTQLDNLVAAIPDWIEKIGDSLRNFTIAGINIDTTALEKSLMDKVNNLPSFDNFKSITEVFSSFVKSLGTVVTSMILSIYFVSEHDSLLDFVLLRIPSDEKRERVKKLVADVEGKLGNWLLGQSFVSLLSMIYSAIILSILRMPFAIPLAVFVALVGLIPNIGASLAAILVALLGLILFSPAKAVLILVLLLIYQPVENTVIYPRVMGNAIGLKPFAVMLGVVAAITAFGPVGGLVALPAIVVLKILYEFYIDLQKINAKGIV